MGDKSQIEWTDATWNCIRGCSRVSKGCEHCYAEREAYRHAGPGDSYEGLVQITNSHPQWTGEVRFIEEHLRDPLKWKKPRRIFVNSMSDLFHEQLSDEVLQQIFCVMCSAKNHTFQILTKRPKRMLAFLSRWDSMTRDFGPLYPHVWPQKHVWLGVSCENQTAADERIPFLLRTPAAVRWVSAEPLLDTIDLSLMSSSRRSILDGQSLLNWVVVGGESGPGARRFDLAWARNIRDQCKEAGVPFFMKQMGSKPHSLADKISHKHDIVPKASGFYRYLSDGKGGDPSEWPIDLRVREYPQIPEAAHG